MTTSRMRKADRAAVKAPEFRVWCDFCSIRIAPNEEQVEMGGKAYHPRCYAKATLSQGIHGRGTEK